MLLHVLMQCIVLATTSISNAVRDLHGIEQRMEAFAPGSSATISGIHAALLPITARIREQLQQLQGQCELAGWESTTYEWQEHLFGLFS